MIVSCINQSLIENVYNQYYDRFAQQRTEVEDYKFDGGTENEKL